MNIMIKKGLLTGVLLTSLALLTSCGGGSGADNSSSSVEEGNTDNGGGGTPTPTAQGRLVRSNEAALSSYFRQSIKQNSTAQPSVQPTPSVTEAANDTAGGVGNNVSSTNIQEAGVDEADLIKTDGRYLYSIEKTAQHSDVIRLMDTQGASGLTEIQRISDTNQDWNFSGIYLDDNKKHLLALSSKQQNSLTNWFNSAYFVDQSTELVLIDVKDPANARIENRINFDGQLISSRRNGDTLYLVLRHYPDYTFKTDDELNTITSLDLLPRYHTQNKPEQLISPPEDCYLNADQTGSSDVITLIAFDLTATDISFKSQCYVGSAEAIYASQNALYLATTRWSYLSSNEIATYNTNNITTDIHKFAYNGLNLEYRGSGEVQGHLGNRQASKSFRFSEYQNTLRVITFDEDQWLTLGLPVEITPDEPMPQIPVSVSTANSNNTPSPKSPVRLTILKEDVASKSLKTVSTLPNNNRPEPIGRPGEQLYASRFIGNRGYVVTFRITDPLYILDLSDEADPFIAGELKVEGYSDYLHPINETLLFAIGKDAVADNSAGDGRGAWYQGVKLSLIDVSDPSNPQETDHIILGKRGTESAALFTHHGLTGLSLGNTYRVAIPVELHDKLPDGIVNDAPATYFEYTQTGLHRFEIDLNRQKIQQLPAMVVNTQATLETPFIGNDRSVLIGDQVYYLHAGKFWVQDWQGNEVLVNPK